MDEGLRGGKGQRLSCPSHSSLTTLQQTIWCMMVHRQSVNGMEEKEGWGGKGATGRGEGREEERIETNDSGEAVVNGKVPRYSK